MQYSHNNQVNGAYQQLDDFVFYYQSGGGAVTPAPCVSIASTPISAVAAQIGSGAFDATAITSVHVHAMLRGEQFAEWIASYKKVRPHSILATTTPGSWSHRLYTAAEAQCNATAVGGSYADDYSRAFQQIVAEEIECPLYHIFADQFALCMKMAANAGAAQKKGRRAAAAQSGAALKAAGVCLPAVVDKVLEEYRQDNANTLRAIALLTLATSQAVRDVALLLYTGLSVGSNSATMVGLLVEDVLPRHLGG